MQDFCGFMIMIIKKRKNNKQRRASQVSRAALALPLSSSLSTSQAVIRHFDHLLRTAVIMVAEISFNARLYRILGHFTGAAAAPSGV